MSERNLHCVYFKYDDLSSPGGYCLLKNEKIRFAFHHCCEKIVLRPSSVLSYFLKHKCHCEKWAEADDAALAYIHHFNFNDYPKRGI